MKRTITAGGGYGIRIFINPQTVRVWSANSELRLDFLVDADMKGIPASCTVGLTPKEAQELAHALSNAVGRLRREATRASAGTAHARVEGEYREIADDSRRGTMLEALRRAQALKARLRAKYGEFDVDKDLEELRHERIVELG